jgi:hypothetical protein
MRSISAQVGRERQQQSWVKSRRSLTDHLRSQVELYVGTQEREIIAYERRYSAQVKSGWRATTKPNLVQAVQNARLVLLADFHGYAQSQRTHRRVLREISAKRSIILFMECFDQTHQKHIDSYLAGALSEKVFLKRVEWQKNWPFPWAHYRPVLQWAARSGARVMGWSRFAKKQTLRARDEAMARQANDVLDKNPDALVVGIVGELHLTPGHLPSRLKCHPVLVFQDLEHVYFNLVRRDAETHVDVVKRSSKEFCILTAPPWVKWQSYLLWLEASDDRDLGQEHEPTDHVLRLLHVLERDFSVQVKHHRLQVFSVETLPNKYLRHPLIKRWLQTDQSFFLPKEEFAYLSRVSVNHAAYLAGLYLHTELSGLNSNLHRPTDLLRRIWQEGLAFFACKLINHKRMANTLDEIRKNASSGESGHASQKILRLALQQRMNEISLSRGLGRKKVDHQSSLEVRLKAAQLVGFMLGERLYLAFRRKKLPKKRFLEFLRKDVFASDFERFYYEVIRLLEPLDRWARDRSERL